MPHRPLARALAALVALCAAALGAVLVPGTAQAAAVNYVALGDSYSSGVGAGPYDSSGCLRSQKSYAPLWAAAHGVTSFNFRACGGAVTADVLNDQVSALSASTTLVTITIAATTPASSTSSPVAGSAAPRPAPTPSTPRRPSPPRPCPPGWTPPTPPSATGHPTPG